MDSTGIEQFHNDLKAALIAGIPLVGGKDHRLTVTELDNLQQKLQVAIADPQGSVGQSNAEMWYGDTTHDDTMPDWYRASLTVFARTGSMLPVLEGLSVRPLAIRDVSRALRWTFIYLLIVAATALLGLSLFGLLVEPAIEHFRKDLLLPAAIDVTPRFDVLPWLPWIIVALAIGLVLVLPGLLIGGNAKLALWLGGRHHVFCAVSTTILRITESLVKAKVAVKDAVSISCALTDADSRVQWKVQTMIQGGDQPKAIGQMADCLRMIANYRLSRLRIVTPVVLTAMLGGSLAVIYCLIVFWPILSLIKDLPTAGV